LQAPDQSVLRSGRRVPVAFPTDVLGPWKDWVLTAAEGANAPVDYVAANLFAAVAALIGNARNVSPWPSWSQPSVLWIAAVGDPSSGKSPGAGPILRALNDVERKLGRDFENIKRGWETEAEVARAKEASWRKQVQDAVKNGDFPPEKTAECEIPEEPVPPRILASDATPEALAKLINANPKGLLYYNDELAGWSGNINRYTNGDNKPMWLSAYDAGSHRIDRKSNKTIHISHFAMSVLGGIQPDKVKRCFLDTDDDGLAARILWFWPDSVPLTLPQSGASHLFICTAFGRLSELQPGLDNDGYARSSKREPIVLADLAISAITCSNMFEPRNWNSAFWPSESVQMSVIVLTNEARTVENPLLEWLQSEQLGSPAGNVDQFLFRSSRTLLAR
jgi:hypothetical protein